MRTIAILTLAALALTACSGDDDDAVESTADDTTEDAGTGDDTTDDTTADETGDETADDDTTDDDGDDTTADDTSDDDTTADDTSDDDTTGDDTTGDDSTTDGDGGGDGGSDGGTGSPATTAPPTTAPPTTAAPATPQLPTADARRQLDAVFAELDAAAEDTIDLVQCAIDPADELLGRVFGGFQIESVVISIGEPTYASAYAIGDGLPAQITCDRFSEEITDGVGLIAMRPPDDLAAFVNAFANPDGIAEIEVTVTPSAQQFGGQFYRSCAVDSLEPEYSYCEIDWVHPDLALGAFVVGASAPTIDLAAFEQALAGSIETMVANLAAG